MAISQTLTLALILLSTLALTATSQDIHKILPAYGLPPGLFPDVESQVNIESNGQISLNLGSDCEVRLPSTGTILHYENKVTGVISFGRIENIKGISMLRQETAWVPVTGITFKIAEDKMEFHLGVLSVLLPMEDFVKAPPCLFQLRGMSFAKV